jgi:anti-anti-sigma factor
MAAELTEATQQGTAPREPRWTLKGPDETTELVVDIHPDAPLHAEVRGELDILTAPWLLVELLRVILWHGPRLVLDLSGVTFMDCAGINTLLAVRRRAQLAGGWLRVINPSRPASRIIGFASVSTVLDRCRLREFRRSPGRVVYRVTEVASISPSSTTLVSRPTSPPAPPAAWQAPAPLASPRRIRRLPLRTHGDGP